MLFLSKFWNGNAAPGGRCYHPDEEYNRRLCKMEEYEKIVKAELSEAGVLAFDFFADAALAFGLLGEEDNYIDGFRMGVMVMLDVFCPDRNPKEAEI